MTPRTLPLARALAAVFVLAPAPAPAQPSPELDARIARIESGLLPAVTVEGRPERSFDLADRMRHHRVPGVSIAVVNRGRIEWARGYGVAEAGTDRPVTPSTLFQAASISKPIAALAALRLVEQGRLALNEPVNGKLRSWKVPENGLTEQRPVTLRGLITHSAGLTVHGFRGYAAGEPVPTPLQVLEGAAPANSAPVRVDLEPGTRWRYSGGGYTVMQVLLEDVAGKPFPELMRELVLEPLGMRASTYRQPLPPERAADAAAGHRRGGVVVAGRWHAYPEMAAAGLWTTPSDLARYIIAVQQSLAGAAGAVLPPATAAAMLTPHLNGWGLGPGLDGEGDALRFSHGGSNEGFKAHFVGFVHRGQGAAVMTNGDNGAQLAREILMAIAREYGWPDHEQTVVTPAAVAAELLRELTGAYRLQGVSIAIEYDGARLTARLGSGEPVELVPQSATEFVSVDNGTPFRFERQDGRVAALVLPFGRAARDPDGG